MKTKQASRTASVRSRKMGFVTPEKLQARGGRSRCCETPLGGTNVDSASSKTSARAAGKITGEVATRAREPSSTALCVLGVRWPCCNATSCALEPPQSSASPTSIDALGSSSVGGGANVIAPRASQSGADACADGASNHTNVAAKSDAAIRAQKFTRVEFEPTWHFGAMYFPYGRGSAALPVSLRAA